MGLIDNVERGLEKMVRGVFTAGSKKRIEPVDLASRMRAEMDNKSYIIAEGRTLAPNVFDIEFSEQDFPRAQDWGQELAEELCDVAIRHARAQGYTLRGAVRVTFRRAEDEDLEAGEFRILSVQERAGRRPQQQADAARPSQTAAAEPEHQARLGTPRTPRRRPQTPPEPGRTPTSQTGGSAPTRPSGGSHRPSLKPVLDINGQRFTIQAPSIVLGRSSEADITVEDTGVSRQHLQILNQDGVFLAVDLGSTNGSTLDGTRLNGRRELADGSVIKMGRTIITFRLLASKGQASWLPN